MKNRVIKLLKQKQFRFLLVGGLNTLVGYGTYAILLTLEINYLIATTISTIIGIMHSYIWNKFFTFKSKEKVVKEIFRFIFIYFISYILGMISICFFVTVLNINEYIAGLMNLVLTTLISWFGHKNFSFQKNENKK